MEWLVILGKYVISIDFMLRWKTKYGYCVSKTHICRYMTKVKLEKITSVKEIHIGKSPYQTKSKAQTHQTLLQA